jgi:hypothetical protein
MSDAQDQALFTERCTMDDMQGTDRHGHGDVERRLHPFLYKVPISTDTRIRVQSNVLIRSKNV